MAIEKMTNEVVKSGLGLISKTGGNKARRYLIYGLPGVGKSTIAAQFPKPVFLPFEDGLVGLEVDAFPLITKYETLIDYLKILYSEKHDYKTIVLDTLDWLETLVQQKVCIENKVDTVEALGFGRGYVFCLEHFKKLLVILQALVDKGINVVILCHATVTTITPPDSSEYARYDLKVNKKVAAVVCEWADIIGFLHIAITTKDNKAYERARELVMDSSPAYVSKNRFNKPNRVDVSGQNFNELSLLWVK